MVTKALKSLALNLLCFSSLLLYSSCQTWKAPQDKAMNSLLLSYSKEVKKYEGLSLIGSRELRCKKIKELDLYYASQQQLVIDDARILLVKAVELLLMQINQNKSLQQYLIVSPFTDEEIDMSLVFRSPDGKRITSPFISIVSLRNGTLNYQVYSSSGLETLHSESYKKALDIIKNKS